MRKKNILENMTVLNIGLVLALLVNLSWIIILLGQRVTSWDPFWHLKAGSWMLDKGEILIRDVFSFTFAGHAWSNMEWGSQIIMALSEAAFGLGGLTLIRLLVVIAIIGSMYFLAKPEGKKNRFHFVAFCCVMCCALFPRMIDRPHILGFAFFSLIWIPLEVMYRRNAFSWSMSLLLAAIIAVWAQCHGSFLVGILLAGSYGLGMLGRTHSWNVRRMIASQDFWRWALLGCLLLVLPLFGPMGLGIYTVHLDISKEATAYIAEWRPYGIFTFLNFSNLDYFLFNFMLLCAIVFFYRNRSRIRIEHIIILAFHIFMASRHSRFLSILGIVSIMVLILTTFSTRKDSGLRSIFSWICLLISIAVLFNLPDRYRKLSIGELEENHYPEGVTAFIKAVNPPSDLFNSYEYGGYLIYELFPDYRVFIDGRTSALYDDEFYFGYRKMEGDGEILLRQLDRYDIKTAVVRQTRSFCGVLRKSEHWSPIYVDSVSALFVRHTDETADLIRTYAWQTLDPCISVEAQPENLYPRPEDCRLSDSAMADIAKLKRAIDVVDHDAMRLMAGGLLAVCGPLNSSEEARRLLEGIKTEAQRTLASHYLGILALRSKQYRKALDLYEEVADQMNKPWLKARRAWAYYKNQQFETAYDLAMQAWEGQWDATPNYLLEVIADTALHTQRWEMASRFYERLITIDGEKDFYFFRQGIANYRMGRFEMAADRFANVLIRNPDDEVSRYNLANVLVKQGRGKMAAPLLDRVISVQAGEKDQELKHIQNDARNLKAALNKVPGI